MVTQGIFYLFSGVLIFSALIVISSRNPVNSALFLVLAFVTTAGLWIMAEAEFLALLLILVYVGAVMTLFLFVVMMLNLDLAPRRAGWVRYFPVGALFLLTLVGIMLLMIGPHTFGLTQVKPPAAAGENYSNVKELGTLLYTHYAYPFELAGALLLVGMIAAISISYRGPRNRQVQQPGAQIAIRANDRFEVITMKTELPDETSTAKEAGGKDNE